MLVPRSLNKKSEPQSGGFRLGNKYVHEETGGKVIIYFLWEQLHLAYTYLTNIYGASTTGQAMF